MRITNKIDDLGDSWIEFDTAISPDIVTVLVKDYWDDKAVMRLNAKQVEKIVKYLQNILKTQPK